MSQSEAKLLSVLSGKIEKIPPVWMMRQAGRHLPEYMELREQARDFLDFCYTPSMASEATLQPIRRYDMDAAILFADILLVLDAMGLDVRFEKGVGPIVEQVKAGSGRTFTPAVQAADKLSPVYETVRRVKSELGADKALIGFAGSPWTVALYAIEGRGKTDQSTARSWAQGKPQELQKLLASITDVTVEYLRHQAEAGADALMMFDSWAEGLADNVFDEVIIEPTWQLISKLRAAGVDLPIIGFPRGAGAKLHDYAAQTGIAAIGLDTSTVPAFANTLPAGFPVQGHLDPLLLIQGGERLDTRVNQLLDAYSDRPYIFNLGHGIRPETPIAHVERVLELIRNR